MPSPHPAKIQSSQPAEAPQFTRWTEVLVECLAAGMTPPEIAKRLEPEDKHRRRIVRKKIWRHVENSQELQLAIAQRAQAIMTMGLPSATQALMKRAKRGRPDAIKLAFEATGFHNPRVKHEHSGDVSIRIEMPRPEKISRVDDDVVDAEVVEE